MSKPFFLGQGIRGICLTALVAVSAHAQTPAAGHDQHQHNAAVEQADQMHHAGEMEEQFQPRESSGTAWLPDETPMFAIHRPAGAWELMWHANAFVQFLGESSERAADEAGSVNWAMLMARRPAGSGRVSLLGMLSLEPWTIRGCGYPDLLASGEICRGDPIHDRQHPHDFMMEIAAEYDRPLIRSLRWQIYAGLAGEPALGPVAYPHRLSAMSNLLAPIGHHWLDSTHISFGVVTTGVHRDRWKVEASAFNGREPDDAREDLDLAALDSFSGRVWFLPTARLALQVSAGQLKEAEAGHDGAPRADVNRVTASATYHRSAGGMLWATTAAWGRNSERDESSHAALVETTVALHDRDTWFGRFEIGSKTAHDLDVSTTGEPFTVAKLQGGYTRYLHARHQWTPGIGGEISLGVVPERLAPAYGRRANLGFGLFITLRPAAMAMSH